MTHECYKKNKTKEKKKVVVVVLYIRRGDSILGWRLGINYLI